ncbi:MAG TPA: hypothetical protein VLJ19_19565 [Variovorax sp.]|nr:hypothetical protein [Variovorax sp.]
MMSPPYFLGAVVALGLVVWAAFYMLGSPLNPAEAVVMVGLCGVLAYGVNAAVRRFFMHKEKERVPAAHDARTSKVHHARTRTGSKRKKRRH